MNQFAHRACIFGLLLALAACDSGGNGSSTGSAVSSGVTFTPAVLEATLDDAPETTPVPVGVILKPGARVVHVTMTDAAGVMDPYFILGPASTADFNIELNAHASLPVGVHSGTLSFDFCMNATTPCTDPYATVPIVLPYRLTVVSATNRTPLAPVAGLNDWNTLQGNVAHTGYVPASFNPAVFTQRWRKVSMYLTSHAVIAGGKIVYVRDDPYVYAAGLNALSEDSGADVWSRTLVTRTDVGIRTTQPSVNNGVVYATTGDFLAIAYSYANVRGFAVDSGLDVMNVRSGAAMYPEAPTIVGTRMYIGGIDSYEIFDIDPPTTTALGYGGHRSEESLAYGDGRLYGLAEVWPYTALQGVNIGSRTPVVNIATTEGSGRSSSVMYVTQTKQALATLGYYGDGPLYAFDTIGNDIDWHTTDRYSARPATDGEFVYAANQTQHSLDALRLADGAVAWRWQAPADANVPDGSNVVVTDNLVFFATDKKTYAISRSAGHAVLWEYRKAAQDIAISANGVLVLRTAGGGVTAFNLH